MFHQTVEIMGGYLKDKFNATDEEIARIDELIDLRTKKRQSLSSVGQSHPGSPSVVIDDFLYHGVFGHASNMKLLNELGIRHIINVCDCELDEEIVENFHVLWINLQDELQADVKKHFEETNQFLYQCRQKNEKVLVHCQMGISRSSAIVLAYLMKYHHDSLNKAYEYLLERRRVAAPNLSFFLQLVRYEKELRATKEIDESKNNDDKENPIKNVDANEDLTVTNKEIEDMGMEQ